jgi:hypothetical protein
MAKYTHFLSALPSTSSSSVSVSYNVEDMLRTVHTEEYHIDSEIERILPITIINENNYP